MRLRWTLGELLAKLRKQKGWGQKELEDASGVDLITISRIERGLSEPKPETVRKITGGLGYKISEIYAELERLNQEETQRATSSDNAAAGAGFRTRGKQPRKTG